MNLKAIELSLTYIASLGKKNTLQRKDALEAEEGAG